MWWLDGVRRILRPQLVLAGLLAVAIGGCQFQPMYAHAPLYGSGPSVQDSLRNVEVAAIRGQIGNDLRNALIYELTGGDGNQVGAPYRLTLVASVSSINPIVDRRSGIPESQFMSFDVAYSLEDVVNGRIVLREQALARVSLDRSQQRFANVRAQRDAEQRAAKVVAEQIRARLASYFLTRT